MSVFVKICGLRTENDVLAAAKAGADAVGFVFASSVREIAPGDARKISQALPAHVRRVAVMQHPGNDRWQEVLRIFAPDVLQTDSEDFGELEVPDTIETWPVYRQGGVAPETDARYVFEGPKSGQGETVDWSQAAALAKRGCMILAGGLGVDNVAEAIDTARPYGVDVSSGVESAPGEKSQQLIDEFVNAVRAAEKKL